MKFFRQSALFRQTMQVEGLSHFQLIIKTLMLILSLFVVLFAYFSQSGAKDLYLVKVISTVNIFFILISVFSLFSSCVTEEKEGDTLGIILMTGITSTGFLMGKALSRLYLVLKLLLLQIPLILLSVTFGGIRWIQVIHLQIFSIAVIILFAIIGILCSVNTRTSLKANFATIAVSMAVVYTLNQFGIDLIQSFSSFTEIAYTGNSFWSEVFTLFGLSCCLFLIASWSFRLTGDSQPDSQNSKGMFYIPEGFRFGEKSVFQKDFNLLAGGKRMFIWKTLLGILLIAYFQAGNSDEFVIMAYTWLFVEGLIISHMLFRSEVQQGTLHVASLLPISLDKFCNMKMHAGLLAMMPAMITFGLSLVTVQILPNSFL